MKRISRIFLLYVSVLLIVSCSTMKHNISKNNKYTERVINSLLKSNESVFYLNSTYSTFSVVWFYKEDSIEIHRLANGKTIEKLSFPNNGVLKYDVPTLKDLNKEIEECGYELDGDGFGFRTKKGTEIEKQDLPINIECFVKGKYKSDFLNKIVEDIITYKMWDVQFTTVKK